MALPVSTICYPLEPNQVSLTGGKHLAFVADFVIAAALIVFGTLCVIQLGVNHYIAPWIDKFNCLSIYASHGGMLATGVAWGISSIVTRIILRYKMDQAKPEYKYIKALNFRLENHKVLPTAQDPFHTAKEKMDQAKPEYKYIKALNFRLENHKVLPTAQDPFHTAKEKTEKMFAAFEEKYPDIAEEETLKTLKKQITAGFDLGAAQYCGKNSYNIHKNSESYVNDFLAKVNEIDKPHRDRLQELYTSYRTLFVGDPTVGDSYYYFPKVIHNNSSIDEQTLTSQRELTLSLAERPDLEMNTDDLENFRTYVASEYKIHFMPTSEHFYTVTEQLLMALSQSPTLRENILTFKVARFVAPYLDSDGYGPLIVIYTQPGKESAQNVFNELFTYFEPHLEEWGAGITPRFNIGSNSLIYYAQGDSNRKSILRDKNPDAFKRLYNENGTLYNSRFGDFALIEPSIKAPKSTDS